MNDDYISYRDLGDEHKELKDYICTHCKSSENVIWDAYATWNVEKQEMQLESSYDQCECNLCGSEDIEEVPYNLFNTSHNKEVKE